MPPFVRHCAAHAHVLDVHVTLDVSRPQITKNLFSDTNLSTRISILKWALESIFAKENEILCDFRSETAKKQSEITKNSDF